jgi:23S rRNA (uracil1939-C5)-methyltransferase
MSETLDLSVERVVPGGEGLARHEGVVVLVEGALPGDRVRALVTGRSPRLIRALAVEVLQPGEARRAAGRVCPRAVERSCGGCDWPAARLSAHRELKTALVRDAFRRIGKLTEAEIPELAWRGSGRGYRLRSRLHWDGDSALGFFAPASRSVATLAACDLVSPSLLAKVPALVEALAETPAGELTTFEGREGAPLLAAFRPDREVADAPALALRLRDAVDGAIVLDECGEIAAQEGPSALEISAGGALFRVTVTSFFQGNRHLLDGLLEEAAAAVAEAGPVKRAFDLYAGGGFLTWPLLAAGAETSAVEIDPSSFGDLSANLARWGGRSRAIRSTAEKFLGRHGVATDLVVADPPRAGLSPGVRAGLLARPAAFLLLVSCDPVTLARDLDALRGAYRIVKGTLLDLFPQTHHVETLLLLARK